MAKPDSSDQAAVLEYVDQLYGQQQKWRELSEYLHGNLNSTAVPEIELLWRLLRCVYRLSKQLLDAGDTKEAENILDEAMKPAQAALTKEDGHFNLHKWYGISLSLEGDIKGIKRKIETSHQVKEHFLKAIQLKPDDGYIKNLLGRWCYKVASVPWYQRKLASTLLATPPTSSYEEALSYFEGAEQASPGFFKANWLWLGKTYHSLGKKAEARQWLQKLVELSTDDHDLDAVEAQEEAKVLLKKI